MKNRIKILFEYQDFEDNYAVESLWAIRKIKDVYKIDNIPFYVKGFALGDIVSVEKREGELYVVDLLEESGHSTVRILFNNISEVSEIRNELLRLKCSSEISNVSTLVSVDIPPHIPYNLIKEYLDQGELDGRWGYQEACIAQ